MLFVRVKKLQHWHAVVCVRFEVQEFMTRTRRLNTTSAEPFDLLLKPYAIKSRTCLLYSFNKRLQKRFTTETWCNSVEKKRYQVPTFPTVKNTPRNTWEDSRTRLRRLSGCASLRMPFAVLSTTSEMCPKRKLSSCLHKDVWSKTSIYLFFLTEIIACFESYRKLIARRQKHSPVTC